ncbi:hypothetical protein LCGC14_1957770 [marine sediment metagenome]|uniref:LamG-like jellyroll fold domain-containing protein n=1 Tax=marine sediment metagenome TaxID=412755 RepID=A0A0F9ICL4_9ZZZZ
MAWSFDESNDDVQITDDPVLTLPDGNWAIAGWVKLDNNTGSLFQYFFSWGGASASPSINLLFNEASAANPNELRFLIADSGGDQANGTSTGTPGTSTAWQHIIVQRSGNTFTQYVDGSADGSTINADVNNINLTSALYLGARSDEDNDRRFGGDMAEWAKWDRALVADERAALVLGFSPLFFQRDLKWYLPMVRPYVELKEGLTVTNDGSTIGAHPAIIYPGSNRIGLAAAAAAGVTVTPPTLALILSEFAPIVTATGDIVVTPSTLAQTLTTFVSTVATPRLVTPSTLTLVLSEFVPSVVVDLTVTPSALALNLSEFAPTVSTPRLVTPTTLALVLTEFVPTVTVGGVIAYTSYGGPFLYTAANWNGVAEFFLEVYLKAIAGTVRARLYNDTDATVVTDSGLSTAATSYTRLRSSALSLTDGKIYLVQFGTESVANGEFKAGKLIAV